ncbi:MAG TPA: sugar phosphate isomerase/epimerase [Planctomycetes bacterium]|nr:sugar phosphate isomerase/epimerase [Planctomycetota bacterium]
MLYGVCTAASGPAPHLKAVDFIEENVQGFLKPRDADAAAWGNRLAAARQAGRPILAANCFLPGDLPCVGPQVDRAAILAWATVAFARAAEAGMTRIVFGSGASRRIPEGFSRALARDQFVDLLREIGPVAATRGVLLVVEPLNRGECNFINSVDEGAAIVRDANVAGVRLLADLYHMARDGEGPESLLRAGDLLQHVHVAEREQRTAPGVQGDDFGPWLRALAAIRYQGAISIESGWSDMPSQLTAAIAALRRQVEAAFGVAAKR